MKKYDLLVAVAIFALATVSCGKKVDTQDPVEVIETVEKTVVNPGNIVAQYEVFADKYIALLDKIRKGDAVAAQELSTLATEVATFQQKLATEQTSLTKEQQDKIAAIAQKVADAVAKGAQQAR